MLVRHPCALHDDERTTSGKSNHENTFLSLRFRRNLAAFAMFFNCGRVPPDLGQCLKALSLVFHSDGSASVALGKYITA